MKLNKKLITIASMMFLLSAPSSFANEADPNAENIITQSPKEIGNITGLSGTDRFFRVDMPTSYQNNWFVFREKETKSTDVAVRIVDKESGCEGITGWVENSLKVRITPIVEDMGSFNYNYILKINDSGSAGIGKSVRLGYEDGDKTSIFKHNIAGYVNYR